MQCTRIKHGPSNRRQGFSLIELVIVIVIIGVIAAIAIPRMTQGADNAGVNALKADLQVLRQAVELYRAEHDGTYPSAANFKEQMTKKTKIDGTVDTTGDYGPYLAKIPQLPVSTKKGASGVVGDSTATTATDGWVYDPAANPTIVSATGTEADGTTPYNSY